MKPLTFKGFLKLYTKSLSKNKTSNIKKLANEVAKGNIRLKEPLLLLSMFDDSSDKALSKNELFDEYRKLKKQYPQADYLLNDIADENSEISNNYKKVYCSYLFFRDKYKRDNDTKLLMKQKIENLQQQKSISDYHINKEFNINPGNYNAFMKHNKLNKISLNKTRKILDYLEKRSSNIMKNPWEEINLSDYENHMKLDQVMKLQALNKMMKRQFCQYPVKTIMILGIAGGNGLEHIDAQITEKIYGVDINKEYLQECAARYENLNGLLECLCADLTDENIILPYADIVIANLLIEYIGYECFERVITRIKPKYVSCIIQINTDDSFVSDSPYLNVFNHLDSIHHQIEADKLTASMKDMSYHLLPKTEYSLPNGKKLVQLDFQC